MNTLAGINLYMNTLAVYPTIKQKVQSQQQAQVKYKGQQSHANVFNQGYGVVARNFAYGECWIPGY